MTIFEMDVAIVGYPLPSREICLGVWELGVWGGAPEGIVMFLKEIRKLWKPGTL